MTKIAKIPIPPNHCVVERHIKIVLGKPSTSAKMVAPVVVNPDVASNTATWKDTCGSQNKYGRADTRLHTNQPTPTSAIASRRLIKSACLDFPANREPSISRAIPRATVSPNEIDQPCKSSPVS